MPVLPLETKSSSKKSMDGVAINRAYKHTSSINKRAESRRSSKSVVQQTGSGVSKKQPEAKTSHRTRTISDIKPLANLSVAEIAKKAKAESKEQYKVTEIPLVSTNSVTGFDIATPTTTESVNEPKTAMADDISDSLNMMDIDPFSGTITMTPSFGVIRRPISDRFNKAKIVKTLTWVAIIIAISAGIYGTWLSFLAANKVEETIGSSGDNSANAVGADGPVGLDEDKPDISAYKVAADMPRTISVPKIGAYGRVLPLGTEEDNKLAAPDNIYDAGWYDGSVKPGAGAGAAVIDGHKSGLKTPGIFMRLGTLVQGDEISIEKGNGEVIKYSVVSKETVPYKEVDMLKALTPIESGKESLTLITCSGEWDRNASTSLTRDIVYAVRKS